jgi:predicted outer membrane repeat protein
MKGGAVTVFLSIVDLEGLVMLRYNSASKGGAIHAISSKLHVRGNILVSNNSALVSGGGIYLYQSELDCAGQSNLELLGNNAMGRGGGIHAISSTLTAEYRLSPLIQSYVGSKIKLISNRAAWVGGGICLENNAKIKLLNLVRGDLVAREYTIGFYGNLAEYGGALYVADNTTSGTCASVSHQMHSTLTECFLQTPQLQIPSHVFEKYAHARIEFINNLAVVHGSNLYGGLLDRCTQNLLTKSHPNTAANGLQYLMEFSNIDSSDSISSDPVRICFCESYKPDCTYQLPTVNVTKGGRFVVSLVAVDQVGHMISAAIHSLPVSDQSSIGEGQLIQIAGNECTNLTYNVLSLHNNEELVIYPNGPCKDAPLSQRRIRIKFLLCTCPIGFQPDLQDRIRCACECDSRLKGYVTKCDFGTQSLVRQGQPWISYIQTVPANFSDYLIYPFCPLNYCKENAEVNLSTQNGIDAQCATFRTGILCGACQSHYSLSLGSTRCLKCPRYWPIIFVIILVASFLAGLALVALVLVLNLTVAVGTLNGVIFYANIIYANIHTFHPDNRSSFASVFVSWLNLDIGIDVCFIKGMNAYWKTWIQLIFPSYVFFLVLMVIVVSNRSRRFSELIGKKNPVATLATLILISYAKLLHFIIMAFSSATLNYPGPSGGYKRKMWLPNATVDYLKGKHAPLFLAAVLILVAGIVYTTLIFSWQWLQKFNKGKVLKWTRNPKVSGFIEIYHTPYTAQNRHWTGLLLFVRVVLYIASAANVSGDPKINLLIIGSVITGVFLVNNVVGHVYKKRTVEVLEVAGHVNLLLLSLATFFSLENIRARIMVTNISVSIMLLLLLGILFYHVFIEVIVKRWKIANHIREMQSSVEQSKGVSDLSESFQMSTTSTVVDAPKKILCTSYSNNELREALLDHSDS